MKGSVACAMLLALGVAYHALALYSVLSHQEGVQGFMDRLHPTSFRRDTYGEDLYCVYQAGANVLQGHSMYDTDGVIVVVPKVVPFGYPPVLGYAFAAVNLIATPRAAHVGWIFTEEAMLVAMALLLARHLRLHGARRRGLLALLLLFTPIYPEHFVGQYNVLLALFLLALMVLEEKGRRFLSALVWWLSLLVKPSLVVLSPLYLAQGRLLRLCAVFLGVIGVSAPYYLAHPGSFTQSSGIFGFGMVRNAPDSLGLYAFVLDASLRMGLATFPALHVARGVAFTLAAAAVIVLFLDREPDPLRYTCLLVITYALGAQMLWEQSYLMLLPVLGYLAFGRGDRRALVVACLLALPTPFLLLRSISVDYTRPYAARELGFRFDVLLMGALQHGSKALPVLYLWACLLLDRRQHLGLPPWLRLRRAASFP